MSDPKSGMRSDLAARCFGSLERSRRCPSVPIDEPFNLDSAKDDAVCVGDCLLSLPGDLLFSIAWHECER